VKHYLLKKSCAAVIFVVASIACEVILFRKMGFGVFPEYACIPLSMLLIVAGIIFMIPGYIVPVILYSLVLLSHCILSGVNIVLFDIYGDVFSKDLLALVNEARMAVQAGWRINLGLIVPFAVLFAVAFGMQVLILFKLKAGKAPLRPRVAMSLACMSVLACTVFSFIGVVSVSTLPKTKEAGIFNISVRENFDKFIFKVPFFQSFGTYGLIYRNVLMNTHPGNFAIERSMQESSEYFAAAGAPYRHRYQTLSGESVYAPARNHNVIIVMLESFEEFFIHEKYTPALYGLRERGINFANFYGYHKTDVSEAAVILGNYPVQYNLVPDFDNTFSDAFENRFTDNLPFSMPNVLGRNGYESRGFFHNNWGAFYRRSTTHPTFGFNRVKFLNDFPINDNFGDYEGRGDYGVVTFYPEEYFFDSAIGDIMPSGQQFMSFITTFNVHGGHPPGEVYQEKFRLIDDSDYSDYINLLGENGYFSFKETMMKAMVLDDGIQYLLNQLEARGLAKNTTLMLYADHQAYGEQFSLSIKQADSRSSRANKLPAFIYSPNVKGFNHDKLVTHFDLTTTLFDLLGIDYNPHHYLGINAFESRENVVISRLGSVFNDKFYTDGMNIIWQADDATAADLEKFRQNYFYKVNKWGYINNMFLHGNEVFF